MTLHAIRTRLRRVLLAAVTLLAPFASAAAQGYKYSRVPPILYILGNRDFDKLPKAVDGTRRIDVFTDYELAKERASGEPSVGK